MRISTDVGGTFTDLVCIDGDTVTIAKTDTTPPQFDVGVLNAFEQAKIDPAQCEQFVHGTTVVINALLSRGGAKTALITTRGFRDVLEIARGNRPDLFNIAFKKPAPFVPRHLRFEVTERVSYTGEVITPVALREIDAIADRLRDQGVEAVAICFLHSYKNDEHERRAEAHLRSLLPEASIVSSSEVCREWREYERTSTTVLSAYVHPLAKRYLGELQTKLGKQGLRDAPFIMQSNGGISTIVGAQKNPIALVESGPASGVLGAAELGRIIGERNLIALDIGGTTAKTALIEDGRARITTNYRIEWNRTNPGYPIRTPVVDLVEIGNGGGSIAWVDEGGRLHVGPQSAGSSPGPAAYGRGGGDPTTTDANLLLGRINPKLFLGGAQEPDFDNVRAVFRKLADRLGGDVEDVARGIVRIANANMVNALKLVSLNRGYDPRDFALIAFGGGGAMHAVSLADELMVSKVIIPAHSSVFSAWGMLMSDLRRDFLFTNVIAVTPENAERIETAYQTLEQSGALECEREGMRKSGLRIERYADMRYKGQEHTVKVELPGRGHEKMLQAIDIFHTAHKREFTYSLDAPIEIVNFHIAIYSEIKKHALAKRRKSGTTVNDIQTEIRKVDFDVDGIRDARCYDWSGFEPDMAIEGPAIIEDATAALVLPPGRVAVMDDFGNIHIDMER